MNQKHLLLLCAIYTLVVSVLYAGGPYSLTPTQYEIDTAISSVTASLATKATSASVTTSLDAKAGTSGAGVASTAFSTAIGCQQFGPRGDCRTVYQFWHDVTAASYTSPCQLFDVSSASGSMILVRGVVSIGVLGCAFATKYFEVTLVATSHWTGNNLKTVTETHEGLSYTADPGTFAIGDLAWSFDGTTLTVDPNITGAGAGDAQYPISIVYEVTLFNALTGTTFTTPTVTAR